jgi:hypothetical protein
MVFARALLALVALSGAAHAQIIDRTEPAATAEAFLTAYKARDLAAIAGLANANNQPLFAELARDGEAHPAYEDVFSGWRAAAADGWDGTIGAARYDGGNAVVAFGEFGDNEIAVVILTSEAGGWAVEDINSPSRASFEALPERAP